MTIALLMLLAVDAAPTVSVVPLGEGRWRLTIVTVGRDIRTAEPPLVARARQLCRGKTPTFGKYRFAATAPLTGVAPGRAPTLTLTQDISCSPQPPVRAPVALAAFVAPAAEPASAGLAFAKRYLIARETGDRTTLRATVDAEAMSLPEMLRGLSAENAQLGARIGKGRYKVTVYRDPPDSPGPGTYIAVDYALAYRNAPSVCGYVIVHEPPGLAMRITREERTVIEAKSAARMSPAQLAEIRERFRCNIPDR